MRTMAASVRQLAQHQAQMQGYIQTMHMQRNYPQGEDLEDPGEEQEANKGLEIGLKLATKEGSHQESPPRNRRERRAREAEARAESEYRPYQPPQGPYHQPPQGSYHQPHHYEEDQQAPNPFPPPVPECPKKTRSFEVDDDDENLPFSEGIRNAPIPNEFRVPKITPYTGKWDPLDHVNTYKTEMSLRGATPALKCRAFHLTLSGGDKEMRLHDIRQTESEPLQSYLSRFNEEMLFCERITDAEALSALKGGLDMNHPFWRDVRNKNPTTFDQLVEMIMEEITNKNMILHRNRGGVAPNQVLRVNYGKAQVRHLPQPLLVGEITQQTRTRV
ncbi:Uncharacterized protein Adt_06622 [Abeliophyllum distichum]|uniref:Retrotransposon gag domain-containing protein n=1 Tax=Abeliophyllum distichum TaxID=126358 RepID=A0ABD1V7X7_9LAMI